MKKPALLSDNGAVVMLAAMHEFNGWRPDKRRQRMSPWWVGHDLRVSAWRLSRLRKAGTRDYT